MAKAFSTLIREVAMSVEGCPNAVIEHFLCEAAIQLCHRSHCWYKPLTPVSLHAGDFPYSPRSPVTGAAVNRILSVVGEDGPLDEIDVRTAQMRYTNWQSATGDPESYVLDVESTCRPVPLPSSSQAYEFTVSLEPEVGATTIDDAIYQEYRKDFVYGAIAMCAALPNKPWTSPDLVALYGPMFEKAIEDASHNFTMNFVRPTLRSKPIDYYDRRSGSGTISAPSVVLGDVRSQSLKGQYDGVNNLFTIDELPRWVAVYLRGLRLQKDVGYQWTGRTIIAQPGYLPTTNSTGVEDSFVVDYQVEGAPFMIETIELQGVKDGSNAIFTLPRADYTYVGIYLRGRRLQEGVGYTRDGSQITAKPGYLPMSVGDQYEADVA